MERERKLYLAVLGFGVLAGLIAANQYVGFAYGYDPRLGWSVGQIAGVALYLPIAFPVWLLTIARTGPAVFDTAGLIFVGAMFVPFLLAVMLTKRGQREVRQPGLGHARGCAARGADSSPVDRHDRREVVRPAPAPELPGA